MRAFVGAVFGLMLAALATAQTPGEWKYTIATDLSVIPEDMRVNFPTVSFSVCRTADDFSSARAFSIQPLASSESRCALANVVRIEAKANQPAKLRFEYSCDQGKSLSGVADAVVDATRFVVALDSKYDPPVSGVARVKQTMRAQFVGACKKKPDADLLKTE
jgi:hypothetical protein